MLIQISTYSRYLCEPARIFYHFFKFSQIVNTPYWSLAANFLADKYLNSLSAKYYFRTNNTTAANELISMFTRDKEDENFSGVHHNQTMWYEDHQGRAYYRQGNYRLALKNFTWIKKHLNTIAEDCEDFSNYAFRKGSYN